MHHIGHGNCVELRELFLSGCEKITDKVLVELGRDSLSADATAPEEFEKTQKVDMFRFGQQAGFESQPL